MLICTYIIYLSMYTYYIKLSYFIPNWTNYIDICLKSSPIINIYYIEYIYIIYVYGGIGFKSQHRFKINKSNQIFVKSFVVNKSLIIVVVGHAFTIWSIILTNGILSSVAG